jgi:putative transposase
MRYLATEKLEIIRLVEQSHLPSKRTLTMLGIPRTTLYRWYERYEAFGLASLEDRSSTPGKVWNKVRDNIRQELVKLALDEPDLSPRELAVKITDEKQYFVSEPTVYRVLEQFPLMLARILRQRSSLQLPGA